MIRGYILRLDREVARWERVAAVLLLAVTVCIVILQIFFRYVLNDSLSWSEEAARYLFIWAAVLGFSSSIEARRLFSFDMVATMLPPAGKLVCRALYGVAVVVFVWALVVHGGYLASMTMNQSSPAMNMPMSIAYAALPVGGVLMALHFVAALSSPVVTPAAHETTEK